MKLDLSIWRDDGHKEVSEKSSRLKFDGSRVTYTIYKNKVNPNLKMANYLVHDKNIAFSHFYESRSIKPIVTSTKKKKPELNIETMTSKIARRSPTTSSSSTHTTTTEFSSPAKETVMEIEDTTTMKIKDHLIATPQYNINQAITLTEAKRIITLARTEGVTLRSDTNIIMEPKGGDCFVWKITSKNLQTAFKHISYDGMLWKRFTRPLEDVKRPHTKTQKHHFRLRDPENRNKSLPTFTKNIFILPNIKYAMTHYLGDEQAYQDCPRNTKIPHPTIEQRIRELDPLGKKRPSHILRELMLNTKSEGHAKIISDPKITQVKYFLQKIREERKLRDDEILNVKHLSDFMGETYIRHHRTIPSNQVILALEDGVEEFKHVLRTIDHDQTLELHYDTSFEFSNKYLSTLSYRHPLMERRVPLKNIRSAHPIVPLITQLHETRSKNDHQIFLHQAKALLGDNLFDRQRKVFVTDEEFQEMNAWPNTNQAYCWLHQRQNIEFKAKQVKVSIEDRKLIQQDVIRFLSHQTEDNYLRDKFNTFENAPHWNTRPGLRMQRYFDRYKHQKILNNCGRWKLEEFGLPNPEMGITNNPAETLNSQLAQYKGGRGRNAVSLDDSTLNQFYFEKAFNNQLQAAYFDEGPFRLGHQYVHQLKDKATMPSAFCLKPEEIKMKLKEAMEPKDDDNREFVPAVVSKGMNNVQKLAQAIVEHGEFELWEKGTGHWVGLQWNKENFLVDTVQRTCSCKSTTICSHMLAARVITGLQTNYNLPTLKKKSETDTSKTFPKIPGRRTIHGTKRPMKHDLTSTAVHPKSIVQTNVPPPTWTFSNFSPDSALDVIHDIFGPATKSSKTSKSMLDTPVPSPSSWTETLSPSRTASRTTVHPIDSVVVDMDSVMTSDSKTRKASERIVKEKLGEMTKKVERKPIITTTSATAVKTSTSTKKKLTFAKGTKSGNFAKCYEKYLSVEITTVPRIEDFQNVTVRNLKPGRHVLARYKEKTGKDNEHFAFKMCSEGRVIILTNDENFQKNDYFQAVRHNAAMFGSLTAQLTQRDGEDTYVVRLAGCYTTDDVNEKAKKMRSDAPFKTIMNHYRNQVTITCKCGYPCFNSHERISCNGCATEFHQQCINGDTCYPCGRNFEGLTWGDGDFMNTCTVDNLITMVADHTKHQDEDFLNHFNAKNCNNYENQFAKAVELTMTNESLQAHEAYAQAVKSHFSKVNKNPKNFYGSTSGATMDHFKDTCTLQFETKCTKSISRNCKKMRTKHHVKDMYLQKVITNELTGEEIQCTIEEAINSQLFAEKKEECIHCKDELPKGETAFQITSAKTFANPAKPTAILTFNNTISKFSKEEITKAPDVLQIRGENYRLLGTTLFEGNHFTSLYKINGHWLHYDGRQERKIREILPQDLQTTKVPEQIFYVHVDMPEREEPMDAEF